MSENYKYAGFCIDTSEPHFCKVVVEDSKNNYFFFESKEENIKNSAYERISKTMLNEKAARFYFFGGEELEKINTKYKVNQKFQAFYSGSNEMKDGKYVWQQSTANHFIYGTEKELLTKFDRKETWQKLRRDFMDAYKYIGLIKDKDKKAIIIENIIRSGRRNKIDTDTAKIMIRERNTYL